MSPTVQNTVVETDVRAKTPSPELYPQPLGLLHYYRLRHTFLNNATRVISTTYLDMHLQVHLIQYAWAVTKASK